jgi:guanylate kinase
VYEGRYYGTLKSEIVRIWNKNNNVLFDVDVEGGINIKKQYGDKALSIFVKPPSIEELRNRLIKRDTDSIEEINKRVDKAKKELEYADEFDFVILNDDLEEAKVKTENILNEFLNKE